MPPSPPMLCRWGRRGFIGFLSAGDGIPMSDCFIRWFWAGFAADAAPNRIILPIIIRFYANYTKVVYK